MISHRNLNLIRHLSQILFFLRVIPFTWNAAQKKYLFFPHRVPFSFIHVLFTLSHLFLSLIALFLCSTRIRACHPFEISASFFTLTFMSMILTCHATVLQDAGQVTIAHNLTEAFVKRLESKIFKLVFSL